MASRTAAVLARRPLLQVVDHTDVPVVEVAFQRRKALCWSKNACLCLDVLLSLRARKPAFP